MNHLGGHLAVDLFEHGPAARTVLALLVSGGHTHLLHVRRLGEPIIELLGATVDDAAGEAYDKVARLLGLGIRGTADRRRWLATGTATPSCFPRGMTGPGDDPYDFSFSGLKTAVARWVEDAEWRASVPRGRRGRSVPGGGRGRPDPKAVEPRPGPGVSTCVIAGGVAANSRLRELADERCAAAGLKCVCPGLGCAPTTGR